MLTVRLHGPDAAPDGALAAHVRAALAADGPDDPDAPDRSQPTVRILDARPPPEAPAYAQLAVLTRAQVADLAPDAPRTARDTVVSQLLGWYADALRDVGAATAHPPPFLVLLRPAAEQYSTAAAAAAHETLASALAGLRGAVIYRATGAHGLPPAGPLRRRLLVRWWHPYAASGEPFRQ